MDTQLIESRLKEIKGLPVKVRSWDVMEGEDATSDSAIWVWVTLERPDAAPADRAKVRQRVRDAIRDAANDSAWVYVRFRDEIEEAQEA